ncbi:MAG: RHS repeat-associated core domain-containing protein, partial [Pseudomonadota bacterium]
WFCRNHDRRRWRRRPKIEFRCLGRRRQINWQPMTDLAIVGFSSSITMLGIVGHEMINGVSLVRMNGQVYDPTIGRFSSADPLVPFPASYQSWNRYSYVYNNPYSLTDPTGFGGIGDHSDFGDISVDPAADGESGGSGSGNGNSNSNIGAGNSGSGATTSSAGLDQLHRRSECNESTLVCRRERRHDAAGDHNLQ